MLLDERSSGMIKELEATELSQYRGVRTAVDNKESP
jgi:hypothetical protein